MSLSHRVRALTCVLMVFAATNVRPVKADPVGCRVTLAAPGDICRRYSEVSIVFLGRHVDTTGVDTDDHFRVLRAWKGLNGAKSVVVRTNPDESNCRCGSPFYEDRTYLVFADRNDKGEIEATICKYVWDVNEKRARDAMAFMASLDRPVKTGSIDGRLSVRLVSGGETRQRYTPIGGAIVTAEGRGTTRHATTDENGNYRFANLPPGQYRVTAAVPSPYPLARAATLDPSDEERLEYVAGDSLTHTVGVKPRGCACAPFVATYESELAGTILNADGSPSPDTTVVVNRVARNNKWPFNGGFDVFATTDADGRFHVRNLAPGFYFVGTNLSDLAVRDLPYGLALYGGSLEAGAIEFDKDDHRDLGALRLPARLPLRRVTGNVVWPDAGAGWTRVTVRQGPGFAGSPLTLVHPAADGTFTLELFDTRTYHITTEYFSHDPYDIFLRITKGAPKHIGTLETTITVDGDRSDLRLVLEPPRPH